MFLTYIQHNGCSTRMLVMAHPLEDKICPDCNSSYNQIEWSNAPIPCPFIQQATARCAIVIKPTSGFFLSYKIGDDLHIGISDSNSVVHSFWTSGITSEPASWDKSILVYQFEDDPTDFDASLSEYVAQQRSNYQPQFYNDIEWNCFDFVMEYLRFTNRRNYTKVHFVAEFVQDALKNAMKYCSLVSKVQERGAILIA